MPAIRRYILTSAQANTDLHEQFWENLQVYGKFLGAKIFVSGYTHNQNTAIKSDKTFSAFPDQIKDKMINRSIKFADKIIFCAEVNVSPTAAEPLSGFETYTKRNWAVFPHPRVSLRSVSTLFSEPAKQIMTTGTVTRPNYDTRKAGLKAKFHHVYGAVLLEIDRGGNIFTRHLIADKDGNFQDLDKQVNNGRVQTGNRVEAINWGDLHVEQLSPDVRLGAWDGPKAMIDVLRPRYQFFHDILDFQNRNHHNINDPIFRFRQWVKQDESVLSSLAKVACFIDLTKRDDCVTVVVESNHDLALQRWLRTADYRTDPVNAEFFLRAQLKMYERVRTGNEDTSFLGEILADSFPSFIDLEQTVFLTETDSWTICDDVEDGPIECGLHGHKGANGAKPSPETFSKMGPKANIGHTHSPGIYDGLYVAGTSSSLDMGYNSGGLSNWANAHIVTYPNGKRTIVTMNGSRWHA